MSETIRFERVVDGRGRDLRTNPDVHFLGGGNMVRGAMGSRTSLDLKGLLVDVPEVKELTGSQHIAVPIAVESFTIDPVVVGATGSVAGLKFEVKSAGTSITIVFRGEKDSLAGLHCLAMPIDASGEDISVDYDSTMGWGGDDVQYQLDAKEEPVRLEVKCVLAATEMKFPFRLESIALPDHASAPAALRLLEFAGASAPVSIEFLGLKNESTNFPVVQLSITNHSNKDVATISCQFDYLDAKGTLLEDFPHSLAGPGSFDGPMPLVTAEKTTAHETTAFFLPEGTKKVRVRIREVRFLDATVWALPRD